MRWISFAWASLAPARSADHTDARHRGLQEERTRAAPPFRDIIELNNLAAGRHGRPWSTGQLPGSTTSDSDADHFLQQLLALALSCRGHTQDMLIAVPKEWPQAHRELAASLHPRRNKAVSRGARRPEHAAWHRPNSENALLSNTFQRRQRPRDELHRGLETLVASSLLPCRLSRSLSWESPVPALAESLQASS